MDLFIYLLKSSGLLALFYFVYLAVLRKETFFKANRLYLLFGILASLTLPFITFTKTIYKEAPLVTSFRVLDTLSLEPTLSEASSYSVDPWILLLFAYILGTSFMLYRFSKQLFSLYTLIKKHSITLQSEYYYIKTKEDISPFSFFKYIVYNPSKHSDEELKMILKHEQSHASQLHSFDIILSHFLLIALWMNPIA